MNRGLIYHQHGKSLFAHGPIGVFIKSKGLADELKRSISDPRREEDCVCQVNDGGVGCSCAFSSRTVRSLQQASRYRRHRDRLPNDPANHPSGNEGRASLQTRLSMKGWHYLILAFADSASEDRFFRPAFLALSLPGSEASSDWKKRRMMGSRILSRSIDRNLPLYFVRKHAL